MCVHGFDCCTGVGALYVRRRPRVRLEPLQNGGGQERGLRSGTVPTPLAVGLGAACSIAQQEMEVKQLCSLVQFSRYIHTTLLFSQNNNRVQKT